MSTTPDVHVSVGAKTVCVPGNCDCVEPTPVEKPVMTGTVPPPEAGSNESATQVTRWPCCLHCTHFTAHHPDAWHARPCERCQA